MARNRGDYAKDKDPPGSSKAISTDENREIQEDEPKSKPPPPEEESEEKAAIEEAKVRP